MVGRLKKVDLRKVWANEAKDFTSWSSENLDLLSDHIDCELSLIEPEKKTVSLSVDIFAEGPNGETVIIENQLEKTDHDHLGKLITYLSNLDAKIAIWITSNPRLEHVTAINWLNEISPVDISFYLVRVEAYVIGDSEPAPLFTTICGPSREAKEIGEQKQDLAERHLKRIEFWKKLLDKAKEVTSLHSNVSPSKDNWITAGAGKSGMGWSYTITMDRGCVELFIDRGPDKKDETDKIYVRNPKRGQVLNCEFLHSLAPLSIIKKLRTLSYPGGRTSLCFFILTIFLYFHRVSFSFLLQGSLTPLWPELN